MALKKPLALYNGEIEQLQPGDDIDAPTSGAIEITVTNDNAGALVFGTPVYNTASIAAIVHVDKAAANAAGTSKLIGLVSQASIGIAGTGQVATGGNLTGTTGQWDAVMVSGSGGLIANTDYYLDTSTGKITTVALATAAFIAGNTAGNYLVYVGQGLDTVTMRLNIGRRMLF